MEHLREYEEVRVVRLVAKDRFVLYYGISEPPQIGDEGTIVDMTDPLVDEPWIYVELHRLDAHTFWLATFYPEELEAL